MVPPPLIISGKPSVIILSVNFSKALVYLFILWVKDPLKLFAKKECEWPTR